MEITIANQQDRDAIVDEAVGQSHGTAPPKSLKETVSPQKAAYRNAPAPGANASVPEKTAAAVGERVGDAYADPGNVPRHRQEDVGRSAAMKSGSQEGVADSILSSGRRLVQSISEQLSYQRFATLVAAFGLGFITAVLLQGRC